MTAVSLLCSTVAFLMFGVATDRHHRRHMGGWYARPRARILIVAGWLLLGLTIALPTMVRGAEIGPIVGVGAIMIGAAAGFVVLNAL